MSINQLTAEIPALSWDLSHRVHDWLLDSPALVVLHSFTCWHAVHALALGGTLLVTLLLEHMVVLQGWTNAVLCDIELLLRQH